MIRVQENQEGLKLSVTHQLLFCADDNFLRGNRHAKKKNTELLLVAGREIGLEVNDDKGRIHSCLLNRIQYKITTLRQVITNPLRVRQSPNTWVQL